MKKFCLTNTMAVSLILFCLNGLQAQTTQTKLNQSKANIDVTKEKEAILKVLHEEGDAFAVNDLKRISAVHIQDNTATRLEQGSDSYKVYKGWDEIEKLYENYIKGNTIDSSWKSPKNLKENIIIKVMGNSAWVLCDNKWKYVYKDAAGKEVAGEDTNMQIAFFEKTNGEWKFSFNGFVQKPEVKAKVVVSK
jgi:hypothetical protein